MVWYGTVPTRNKKTGGAVVAAGGLGLRVRLQQWRKSRKSGSGSGYKLGILYSTVLVLYEYCSLLDH